MKKQVTLVLFILCVAFTSANAQFFNFGVKGGVNFSDQTIDIGDFDLDPSHRTGFNAGLFFALKLPVVGLGVEADVLYSQKGSKFDMINPLLSSTYEMVDIKTRFSYIDIPLYLRWSIGFPFVKPYVGIGPSFSFAVQKKIEGNFLDKDDFEIGRAHV